MVGRIAAPRTCVGRKGGGSGILGVCRFVGTALACGLGCLVLVLSGTAGLLASSCGDYVIPGFRRHARIAPVPVISRLALEFAGSRGRRVRPSCRTLGSVDLAVNRSGAGTGAKRTAPNRVRYVVRRALRRGASVRKAPVRARGSDAPRAVRDGLRNGERLPVPEGRYRHSAVGGGGTSRRG